MKVQKRIAFGSALVAALVLVAVSPVSAQPAGAQQPATATAPVQLGATDQAPIKVAVINGEQVLAESNIGRQVQAEAQAADADWQSRLTAKQAEIDALVQQGQEQRLTLNQQALDRLQGQVDQLQLELQRLVQDRERALTRLAETAQLRINQALIPAVEKLAQENGYDLILDTRIQGILYFANRVDVTAHYIEIVNAGGVAPEGSQQ